MQPNLFNFATSELSQDAFLCWLLTWSQEDKKALNSHLHKVSTDFIELCLTKGSITLPSTIQQLEIIKQLGCIDVLCIINKSIYIIIEDKCGTKEHGNQLQRYKSFILNEYNTKEESLALIYIQTRDQGDYSPVIQSGYSPITRKDLLALFNSTAGTKAATENNIFHDFKQYLIQIESDYQSFTTLPVDKWSSYAWRGFYARLKDELNDGHWDYVANPSGGFEGFWWNFNPVGNIEVYLQLEQDKFCFKLYCETKEERKELRNIWHNKTMENCLKLNLKAKKPTKFGNGTYMTVTILEQDYRFQKDDGTLDFDKTLETIRNCEKVLEISLA